MKIKLTHDRRRQIKANPRTGSPCSALASAGSAEINQAGGQTNGAPIAPGMLRSHYSPRASLRLFAKDIGAEEAGLDFAGVLQGSDAALRLDLSPSGDLVEAAANLFSFLRRLDAEKVETIAVAPIPMIGLGAAINDRLARAAAPKS